MICDVCGNQVLCVNKVCCVSVCQSEAPVRLLRFESVELNRRLELAMNLVRSARPPGPHTLTKYHHTHHPRDPLHNCDTQHGSASGTTVSTDDRPGGWPASQSRTPSPTSPPSTTPSSNSAHHPHPYACGCAEQHRARESPQSVHTHAHCQRMVTIGYECW